jgi:hypothetical protein
MYCRSHDPAECQRDSRENDRRMHVLLNKSLPPEIAGQRLSHGHKGDRKYHNADRGESKGAQEAGERQVFVYLPRPNGVSTRLSIY